MNNDSAVSNILALLNAALARELQVSVQYMVQHAIGAGWGSPTSGKTPSARRDKFVASHSNVYLPGVTLKKIAITEMRHAEAIAERIVVLGGEPTTQPDAITLGRTAEEMLEIDRLEEQGAIEMYRQIIDAARKAGDDVTMTLFQHILSDEENHHRVFSNMLGAG